MQTIKIDEEFRDKIPAMPQEDFEGLRADILRDGYVRDPLVVWDEEDTLLDGHHRWRVIQEHPELPYTVDRKSFPDRWAAIAWICANQLHKHNMTELQRMKLIQEEHDARQKTSGGQIGNKNAQKQGGEIHHLVSDEPEVVKRGSEGKELKTRPTIAKEHGITEAKVKTAVEVGRGIDRAAEVDPQIKNELLSGKTKATKSDIAAIRNMESDEEVKEAISNIREGKRVSPRPRPQTPEMKEFNNKLNAIVETMENGGREYTIDDAVGDLNSAEDMFLMQVRFVLTERADVINTERGREEFEHFIKSVIEDLNELKGELK